MTKSPLCKNQHPDGRVCDLYLDHYGDHKEKHLRSSWHNLSGKAYEPVMTDQGIITEYREDHQRV